MKRPSRPAATRSLTALHVWVVLAVCVLLVAAWILARTTDRGARADAARGAELFVTKFTPEEGLGPLFNAQACSECHAQPAVGGMGPKGLATVLRVGRLTHAGFNPLVGGRVAHSHSISELGVACGRTAGVPAGANLTSVRNSPALFGDGLIDAIPDRVIRAGAVARGDGVKGRPNLVRGPDGRLRVGRFGWKASTPTLELIVAEALRTELGVTSALAPGGPPPPATDRCLGESDAAEAEDDAVKALTAFVASLAAPRPRSPHPTGGAVFKATGCAACHVPTLRVGTRAVPLYSDLLLHDMGRVLDDRVVEGAAKGPDWRTTPLWGLRNRPRYLHDGRAQTLEAAIVAHGGEADTARRRFLSLSARDRRSLLEFLRGL